MQKMFAPSQVELRQIGPRDVAKSLCGMGACGLETRCCCLFLTEFSSISIRMAKEQGISLTPSEITGMCGRLRCCLIYEYDNYVEARAKLPKRNKRVRTPQGEGKVVDVIPLREAVVVDLPELGRREFPGTDVQVVDGEGGQPVQPYRGTQQPSEMDQAITGVEGEHPFEIAPGQPKGPADWENPPSVTQPRSMPRTDRPRREERRGGKDMPGGKDLPGGTNIPSGGNAAGTGSEGGEPGAPRERGTQPGRGIQPGRGGQGRSAGERPRGTGQDRPRSKDQRCGRPSTGKDDQAGPSKEVYASSGTPAGVRTAEELTKTDAGREA